MGLPLDLLVAFIGGIFSVITVVLVPWVTKRDRLTHAYAELAGTITHLQTQINIQEKKISELKKQLAEYELRDNEKTQYIRQLDNWVQKTCGMLDKQWLADNPKPKLPESLKEKIKI